MFFIICVQLHYISYIVVELCAQTCDIYIYMYIYIYTVCIYIYMCVCVCVWTQYIQAVLSKKP